MSGTGCLDSAETAACPNSELRSGKSRTLVRHFVQWIVVAVMGFASYWVISHFLLQTVSVVGVSMVPTLEDSHRYLLNRWVYFVRDPKQNEIVVLRDPLDSGFSVKRVIAGPGHTVYLKGGCVYVDGARLEEPYLQANTPTFTDGQSRDQLFRCYKGQFFVLGDNRPNSLDSRAYGPVARQNIIGMIVH